MDLFLISGVGGGGGVTRASKLGISSYFYFHHIAGEICEVRRLSHHDSMYRSNLVMPASH